MSQTGYSKVQIYSSSTATNTPSASNLTNDTMGSELAINITDGKLFYKDNSGTVQVMATKGTGPIGGSNTQVQYNSSGALAGSANLTFDGTTLTANTLSVSTSTTTPIVQSSGSLLLKTNGTTTAVTIDTAQNVGVGVTPNTWTNTVVMQMGANATYGGAWYGASTTSGGIYLGSNNYYNSGFKYQTANLATYYSQNDSGSGAHKWWISSGTPSVNGAVTFTQAMTLDNSGNLLVGTTSLLSGGSGTSSGFNLVKGGIQIGTFDNTDGGIFSSFGAAKSIGMCAGNQGNYAGGSNQAWMKFTPGASGAIVAQVNSNGVQVAINASAWSSYSDPRLKNIIGTYTQPLVDIAQIKPIKFTWKSDTTNTPQVGVDASTVQTVIPEAVHEDVLAGQTEDQTKYLSVRYTELIPLMIASIQELSAQVTALQAKVGA